jgi:co-chaperonin GroES (HSP10)
LEIFMAIDVSTFRPLRDQVFVADLESGVMLTKSGIIIPDDNRTNRGIRNRWARVYAVGPDVEDITVGEWGPHSARALDKQHRL